MIDQEELPENFGCEIVGVRRLVDEFAMAVVTGICARLGGASDDDIDLAWDTAERMIAERKRRIEEERNE